MANSIITATGDGATVNYTINFTLGILRQSYVTCQVNNEVDGGGNPIYRSLEWVTDSNVNIQGGIPGDGEPIEFIRTMPKDELIHDYANGVPIQESNLDDSNLQTIMSIHEFLDGRIEGGFLADIDMNGFRIINLGSGVDDDDAGTMAQLNTIDASVTAAQLAETNAETAETNAAASGAAALVSENNAEDWATKIDGIVEATDYSSKAYAIGGTGVTNGAGAAKEWASKAEDSTVDGSLYSALHWAAKAALSAAGVNLPAIGSGDATKLIKVNAGETAHEFAGTLANFTASKQGALMMQNATDDGIVYLTNQGTDGQWLKSTGPDSDPVFADLILTVGQIISFGGASVPTNFLACDGAAVSRTTYADLFAAIGTTWGSGDGSTTFNVPSTERMALVGSGGSGTGTLGNAVGNTGGAETFTQTTTTMPSHRHNYASDGAGGGQNDFVGKGGGGGTNPLVYSSYEGSGTAHTIMQPSAVVLHCIRYQ